MFVLTAGERSGDPILRLHGSVDKGPVPVWHGEWVLWAEPPRAIVAIDIETGRRIDLSGAVRRIARREGGLARRGSIDWSFRSGEELRE